MKCHRHAAHNRQIANIKSLSQHSLDGDGNWPRDSFDKDFNLRSLRSANKSYSNRRAPQKLAFLTQLGGKTSCKM